jgi:hypothetical protein
MAKKREEDFCFRNYLAALQLPLLARIGQKLACCTEIKNTKRELKQLPLSRGDGEEPSRRQQHQERY